MVFGRVVRDDGRLVAQSHDVAVLDVVVPQGGIPVRGIVFVGSCIFFLCATHMWWAREDSNLQSREGTRL